jgi:polyisoprenoid-binding protein YceI
MRKLFVPAYMAALSLLAACQTVSTPGGTTAPRGLVSVPAPDAVHYTVDAAGSEVRFLVYKAGALAAFGHDHTVDARGFKGDLYLAPKFDASSFSLNLPVAGFVVDEPASRQTEGPDFAKQPSPGAVQGTTTNMLGPGTLDATHYPEVLIQCVQIGGSADKVEVTVRITLHGVARDLQLPITLTRAGDDLTASGSFDIKQSEFGITPFSAVGGGLQVADTLKVKFRILGHKV